MTVFQQEWDDLTYRLVEAFIDGDIGDVNQLVGEAAQHPDLPAILINLGGLVADLAVAFDVLAAKHHVDGLLRSRGAE